MKRLVHVSFYFSCLEHDDLVELDRTFSYHLSIKKECNANFQANQLKKNNFTLVSLLSPLPSP